MPELPDIAAYVEALNARVAGAEIISVKVFSPFLVRTVAPPIRSLEGGRVARALRSGKRIVLELASGECLAMHLMIAGRLTWQEKPFAVARPGGKEGQAVFVFSTGSLLLTEAGSKRRASLCVYQDIAGVAAAARGGIEPLEMSREEFGAILAGQRRTLKRALTDPASFSGIGNAYSDEILHAAGLSPIKHTTALAPEEADRLYTAVQGTLSAWVDRLRREFAGRFPKRAEITAFRPDFAVHGRYGQPCPACGKPVQRVVRAENEFNYCAFCQTQGVILADRALSRLFREDFPRTLDDDEP